MIVISSDKHKHDITCTRFECESKALMANAIDAATKSITASRVDREALLVKHGKPKVSKTRKNTTIRDAQGRILLPPKGERRVKRSNSQRKDGKRVVFTTVLGVGGINNKNIGFVKVLTKDYTGY
jgi:hypothetical protein